MKPSDFRPIRKNITQFLEYLLGGTVYFWSGYLVFVLLDYLIIWSLKAPGVSPYIGFFISVGFFTVWNYLWYRFWVFLIKRNNPRERAV